MSEAIRRGIQAINREHRPLLIDNTYAPTKYTYDYGLAVPAHLLKNHDDQWVNMINYLHSIKPYCRRGAELQQDIDDFQEFSNAIDNFQNEKYFQK